MTPRARLRIVTESRPETPTSTSTSTESVAPTDEALLASCAHGDPAALGTLYDRHALSVAKFLSRLGHVDAADVEDLVHDAFIAVARTAARFRGDCGVRTWILSVAANVARDRARASRRRRAFKQLWALRGSEGRSEGAEEIVSANETAVLLQRALSKLPIEQASVFVMCELEEVPCGEAAQAVGAPIGTVYRWLHDARCALRAAAKAETERGAQK